MEAQNPMPPSMISCLRSRTETIYTSTKRRLETTAGVKLIRVAAIVMAEGLYYFDYIKDIVVAVLSIMEGVPEVVQLRWESYLNYLKNCSLPGKEEQKECSERARNNSKIDELLPLIGIQNHTDIWTQNLMKCFEIFENYTTECSPPENWPENIIAPLGSKQGILIILFTYCPPLVNLVDSILLCFFLSIK